MVNNADQTKWRFIAPTDPEQKIPIKSDDQDDCLVKVYQDIPASLKATVYIGAAESIIVKQAVAANLKATVTQASAARTVECQDGDKIFGFESVIRITTKGVISGANGYYDSPAVPGGSVWKVTNVVSSVSVDPLTRMRFTIWTGDKAICFHDELRAIAVVERVSLKVELYLQANDVIRVNYLGAAAGREGEIWLCAIQMTAP